MIDASRFWKHCMLLDDSPDACWIWVGALNDVDNTGRYFISRRKEIRAHHAAYELRFGELPPPGRRLRRDCNHPQCVRHWTLDEDYRRLSPREIQSIQAHDRALGPLARVARAFGITLRHAARLRSRRTEVMR